jgi:hypothetical protein
MVEGFNRVQLDALQLSIDRYSMGPMTSKALEPLRQQLKLLASLARFEVRVSAVIGAGSPDDLAGVVKTVKDLGFTPRLLLRHGPDGQFDLTDAERARYAELMVAYPDLFAEAGGYRRALLRGRRMPFSCRAGCNYLYVDESGVVRWCSQQRHMFGKSLASYTPDDLAAQFNAPKPCSAKCVVGCARTASYTDMCGSFCGQVGLT